MKRVLVTDGLQAGGVDYLRKEGLEVEVLKTPPEAELGQALRGAHGLIVRSATRVTRRVLEAADELVVVGRAGAGVDNIDVDAATERGVIVMNTPGGNTIAVAEHTIGLLLALARNLPQAHGALKAGRWEKSRFAGVEVYSKTLGVIGLGRIGSEVARRALGLSMKVVAYDPYLTRDAAERLGVESVELADLYERSDFISVHTPLTKDTRNFLDAPQFARMKLGVRLINCARGGVVNEAALAEAIRSGRVGGAALDVFETEPLPPDHPLLGLDRVIVTPHLAASTEEAQTTVALAIAEQVAGVLARGVVLNAVNMP
ncbi:MAG: phosphoglycerate dehydrogenase, partial [Candidatus Rokubacteria bacterium]|nr:phosphoglycerate dehydrogenase [Candidatus Rokubacteria bacterium]